MNEDHSNNIILFLCFRMFSNNIKRTVEKVSTQKKTLNYMFKKIKVQREMPYKAALSERLHIAILGA